MPRSPMDKHATTLFKLYAEKGGQAANTMYKSLEEKLRPSFLEASYLKNRFRRMVEGAGLPFDPTYTP